MSSQAYTPGLKRKEMYLVRKIRKLPIPGEILVKEKDNVSPETVVARTKISGVPQIVGAALDLGVDPRNVERLMVKKIGERTSKGEVIALYEAFFGLIKKNCLSPTAGTIESCSPITGQIVIREPERTVELRAYIPGTVTQVIGDEGAVVECPAALIQGIFGIGGETHGELTIVKNPDGVMDHEDIFTEHRGKVIVGGATITSKALQTARNVGARGVVTGGISDRDLTDFLGYTVGVAITGHEDAGLTLIVTEGFGRMPMSEKIFNLFKRFEGHTACINGATQIRAGVIRPEIIIPRPDITKDIIEKEEFESELIPVGLRPGTSIRIIREPYLGALGTVTKLLSETQVIETMSTVRVLEAVLEGGKHIIVPRANVEIIEE